MRQCAPPHPPSPAWPHALPLNNQDIEAAGEIEMDAIGNAGVAAAAMQQSAEERAEKQAAEQAAAGATIGDGMTVQDRVGVGVKVVV